MSNYHYGHRKSPLEISEMAAFDRDIAGDSPAEQRRKRLFYLRQAMDQLEQGKNMMKSFKWMMIPFYIIPLFWPFLFFAKKMQSRMETMIDTQVQQALDYWDLRRDEIPGAGNQFAHF